ncbi:MAG: hypothetical protein HWN65_15980 [Candidatus Helarchaeota archaeon]|nr:hypothetical protein [Candidatus Helarchaeota archaeon]
MIRQRKYSALGLLAFLLVFTALPPMDAVSWGDPLATDLIGDGTALGEDILAVDAQYANEFTYFQFQLNEPIMADIEYSVFIGYDRNLTNGFTISGTDSGPDLYLRCNPQTSGSDTIIGIYLYISGGSSAWVQFNVTANNGSAMTWSNPSIVPYFAIHTFENGSQADLAFGVNWIWVVGQMAGLAGDGCSLYLEFRTTIAGTDWCPDRTGNATDYIEWNFCMEEGVPGWIFFLIILFPLIGICIALIITYKRREGKI